MIFLFLRLRFCLGATCFLRFSVEFSSLESFSTFSPRWATWDLRGGFSMCFLSSFGIPVERVELAMVYYALGFWPFRGGASFFLLSLGEYCVLVFIPYAFP